MAITTRDIKPQPKPLPKKGRTFNEWVDMIHDHVREANNRRYGINQSPTT